MVAGVAEQAAARRQDLDQRGNENPGTGSHGLSDAQVFASSESGGNRKVADRSGEGGILGEHGIIVWRSSYFVEKSRYGTSGWLYVVHFPQSTATMASRNLV